MREVIFLILVENSFLKIILKIKQQKTIPKKHFLSYQTQKVTYVHQANTSCSTMYSNLSLEFEVAPRGESRI